MSKDLQILPVLDTEELQKKATEFAMKGAIKSIEEFYTGYNSPYRKNIDEQLQKHEIGSGIKLPDIIALINDSLTKEIDIMANTAISKTFIPMVNRFLLREDKEIKLSDILQNFVKATEAKNQDECEIEINENTSYGWLDVELRTADRFYSICLHVSHSQNKEEGTKKYQILSLPRDQSTRSLHNQTMKICIDGAILEMPFTRNILQDDFSAYIARLVIGNCMITIDCKDFTEDMFPTDECHC